MRLFKVSSIVRLVLMGAALAAALGAFGASAFARQLPVAPSTALTERFSVDHTGRVIVGLTRGASVRALSAAQELGGETVSTVSSAGFAVLEPPKGVSAEQFAGEIEGTAGVRFAQPEQVVRAAAVPNDPYYAQRQWDLPAIGLPDSWWNPPGSAQVTVAVIDTGIFDSHEDLAGRVVGGRNFVAAAGTTSAWRDDNGHGTHVAGTIGARTNNGIGIAGIAPQASLLAVKVLDKDGTGAEADMAQGIRWAAEQGADVLNVSIESPEYSDLLDEACQYARSKGCIIVAAAGNSGTNRVSFPAVLPGVIAVGATKQQGNARADFSDFGPELDLMAPGTTTDGDQGVGLWAPVRNVSPGLENQTDRYAQYGGTSMAAPHVAGVAALVRQMNPGAVREQVEYALLHGAKDLGLAGRDGFYGWGMVRADNALHALTPADVDGDIPGLPIAAPSKAGSVGGTLDVVTDQSDVYELYLSAGQRADFELDVPAGADYRLKVYGKGAASLANSTPVAVSGAGDPVFTSYATDASGSCYVRVEALAGAGHYTLGFRVEDTDAPDNEIPGIVTLAGSTTAAGTLDQSGDRDDVYRVSLSVGQGLTATLSGTEFGADFDLWAFSPQAASVDSIAALVAGSVEEGSNPEWLSFSVSDAVSGGVYYIDPRVYVGGGSYQLTVEPGLASKLSISAPATCAWSKTASVSGRLLAYAGTPISNRPVDVWKSTDPANPQSWTQVAYDMTDSTGRWKITVAPKRKTWYRASFEGDRSATYTASESAAKTITPRAYLTRPYAPKSVGRAKYWTAYGYLRPKHATGGKYVKIRCYRWSTAHHKWVLKKTTYATNYYYSKYTTKYKKKLSLPSRGKWKLSASVPGDTTHAATTSYSRYVTVK